MKHGTGIVALVLIVAVGPVFITAQDTLLKFEVASVKLNKGPVSLSNLALNSSPNRLVVTGAPLILLITLALDLRDTPLERENLPQRVLTERYDIVAVTGEPRTQPEMIVMFRRLLEDRFKLSTHREARPGRVYHLLRARTEGSLGRDMKPSAIDCDEVARARRANIESMAIEAQQNGQTLTLADRTLWQPGETCSQDARTVSGTTTTFTLPGSTMAALAKRLAPSAGGPVIDHTGLTGTYAVTLRFRRPDRRQTTLTVEPSLDDAPALEAALREQLGLKLEPHEGTTEIVVIDRIERPTED